MREFSRVYLPKGEVHIYGFSHGSPRHGITTPKEVIQRLREETKSFKRRDYILAEGFGLTHVNLPDSGKVQILDSVPVLYSLSTDLESIQGRIEEPEWYLPFIYHPYSNIRDWYETRAPPEDIRREMSGDTNTRISSEKLKEIKEESAQSISNSIAEVSLEDARSYVETTITFRSLLLSRIGLYRASAYGGVVRLFCGYLHAEEIKRFLEKQKFREDYITSLTDPMKKVYDENENIQQSIDGIFNRHSYKFDPLLAPLFLRWVAYKVYEGYFREFMSDEGKGEVAINIDEFRDIIRK